MKIYKNLLFLKKYVLNEKRSLFIGILSMIVSSLLIAPVPYLMGEAIDLTVYSNNMFNKLICLLLLLVVIYIFRTILTLIYQYFFTKIQYNILKKIRIEMLHNIMNAPMEFIYSKDKGYIMSRVSEVQQIGGLFSANNLNCLMGIIELFFYIFVMFRMNIWLTIAALITMPLYFVISSKSSKKIVDNTIRLQESGAVLNSDIFESLNGIEEIKLLNGSRHQLSKIAAKLSVLTSDAIQQNMSFVKFIQAIVLSSDLITLFILALSCYFMITGDITVGTYTAFSVYVTKILVITQNLGSLDITIKPICSTIVRIKEFFNIENENSETLQPLLSKINNIKFENVSFGYNANTTILNNFNLTIQSGDKIQIIGRNGSGKSTLIKLLGGLYHPSTGNIYINEMDISTLSKDSVRNKIGIVSQNIFLFKGTVLENILYSSPNKTKTDVVDLITDLNLRSYIDNFESGLDTLIMQNGTSISGGQAQFIAFLRALINQKNILILDEATSNLDQKMERTLQNIVKKSDLFEMLIIVSHRDFDNTIINKKIIIDGGSI